MSSQLQLVSAESASETLKASSTTSCIISNVNEQVLVDDEQTSFWKIEQRTGAVNSIDVSIEDSSVEVAEGINSLTINTVNGNTCSNWDIYHEYDEPLDLSKNDFISLWIYG